MARRSLTIPMLMLDQKFLRTTSGSISAPARKVSRMAPKPARKLTQGASGRPMMLPATAPTTISVSATDIPTQIDNMDAASASPIQSADANQTEAIAFSSPFRGGRAAKLSVRMRRTTGPYRITRAVGVISPVGRFWGTPSP